HDGITYAAKIRPDEARLIWTEPAADLERAVRAFNPAPGAWALLPNGERLKVLAAEVEPLPDAGRHQPGDIVDDRLTVLCGRDALRLTLIQREGKRAMPSVALLRGMVLKNGDRLA